MFGNTKHLQNSPCRDEGEGPRRGGRVKNIKKPAPNGTGIILTQFACKIFGQIEQCHLFEFVFHCRLRIGEVRIEHSVDIAPDGTGGVGVFVKVEHVPVMLSTAL